MIIIELLNYIPNRDDISHRKVNIDKDDDDDDALVQPCVPKSHSRVPQPSPRLLPDNHHDHGGCDDYDSIKSYDEYIRKSDTPPTNT